MPGPITFLGVPIRIDESLRPDEIRVEPSEARPPPPGSAADMAQHGWHTGVVSGRLGAEVPSAQEVPRSATLLRAQQEAMRQQVDAQWRRYAQDIERAVGSRWGDVRNVARPVTIEQRDLAPEGRPPTNADEVEVRLRYDAGPAWQVQSPAQINSARDFHRELEARIGAAEQAMAQRLAEQMYAPVGATVEELEREKRAGSMSVPAQKGHPRIRDVWFIGRYSVLRMSRSGLDEARLTRDLEARGWERSHTMDGWIKPRRLDDVEVR